MKPEDDERSSQGDLPYRAIVENSLDAIALIRRDASVLYASPSVTRVLGYLPEEFQGRSVFEFIQPDDRERSRRLFAEALQSPGTPIMASVRCIHRDGSSRSIEVIGVNRFDDPKVGALIANYRDVTDREVAESRLRESEERYRQLFERNLAGLYRSTADGKILDCNETFARMHGYASCDEVLTVNARALYFSAKEREAFLGKLKDKGVLVNYELRGRRKDGSAFWLLENVTLDRSRNPWILEGTMLEITDRKGAEEELEKSRGELRKLSLRLSAAREEERSRIAREIHDELGQKLTVLKMAVARLRRALPRDPENLQSSARGILTSIDELLRTVRDLSTELRPAVLDHLELVDALKWQARDFESRTGIQCRLVCRVDRVTVDPGSKTDLYRVTQEALTNVVRHAGASRVQIQISREAGNLLLEIADNGQGITEEDLNRPNSLGLLGIRERIQALGGTVRLKNAPEGGMKLRIRIPLARETE